MMVSPGQIPLLVTMSLSHALLLQHGEQHQMTSAEMHSAQPRRPSKATENGSKLGMTACVAARKEIMGCGAFTDKSLTETCSGEQRLGEELWLF